MNTIQVVLETRSYFIRVGNGLLSQMGSLVKELQPSQNSVVISSKTILSLHGGRLFRSLRRANLEAVPVLIPEGERYKTLATVEKIYRALSRLHANRKTLLIAFGGGVIGDVAGFAAASYLRGLSYIQVPTTLLAQIDSSIGGKTGVNLPSGKNLVGAFHQPRAVIVDPLLLATLPPRELRSGLYEALKYGVIRSPELLDLVEKKHRSFPQRDKQGLEQMITECARIKAEIVSQDETESELRMVLNYGHTLGHALEAATQYKTFTHGEAIAHGMIMANQLAEQLNGLDAAEAAKINTSIQGIAPLPRPRRLRWAEVYRHMLSDKKFVDQQFRFVLPRRVGQVDIVKDVPGQPSKACCAPICMLSPKARQIRQMFSSIAPRYDLLNHLLSLNIDKSWRRKAVSLMRSSSNQQQALWLDLCCGTGDLSLEMLRQGAPHIVSLDFSHAMLRLNLDKLRHRDTHSKISLVEADALTLPFPADTFDAIAIAFGLRNLESPESGLAEMRRVLKPDGRVVVLEFSKPTNALFDRLFQRYFFSVLPKVGAALSRHHHAYTYLPESVSQFPDQVRLAGILGTCGFDNIGYVNLTGGIAAIHWGQKK